MCYTKYIIRPTHNALNNHMSYTMSSSIIRQTQCPHPSYVIHNALIYHTSYTMPSSIIRHTQCPHLSYVIHNALIYHTSYTMPSSIICHTQCPHLSYAIHNALIHQTQCPQFSTHAKSSSECIITHSQSAHYPKIIDNKFQL